MIRFASSDSEPSKLITRREWLRIGGLAGFGSLVGGQRSFARPTVLVPGFGRAKSVIVIYANGGQSQLETWDPKPNAPLEVRGEFQSIQTSTPGTILSEHLPRIARLSDRFTIVRNMAHDDLDHGSATYLSLTGHFHTQKSANPLPKPTDFPALGAVLTRLRPHPSTPYTAIHVNGPAIVPEIPGPGQDAGFLGREYEPLLIGDVSKGPVAIPDLSLPAELPMLRVDSRKSLLASVDSYRRELSSDTAFKDMDGHFRQAFDLLSSPRSRVAFDIGAEPLSTRERYGLHRSGQACLLARRLAEAEVPLIHVFWNHSARGQDTRPDEPEAFGWDTHNDIFSVMKDHLLPRFDQSFSAMLEDLDQRGLLDQTLVVCMGEFGRAPLVAVEPKFAGALPGRKHWANVYSIVVAGAGVGRGAIVGESDRFAAYPKFDRFGPWDVSATIFSALGIDPSSNYTDLLNRPYPISSGRVISALYQS